MSASRQVIVFGAGGQLGRQIVTRLRESSEWTVSAQTHRYVDITDAGRVREMVRALSPSWVVNAAAFTQVDKCESQGELCDAINAWAAGQMAGICNECGATLLHVSTDYVFDGQSSRPYRENDPPGAISAYGLSKQRGEQYAETAVRHLIVRTAWLYGVSGRNFVDTILTKAGQGNALRVVNDQTGSPSYAPDMADCIVRLMAMDAEGVYHIANDGAATWFELACRAVELAGFDVIVKPISTAEYPTPARRPAYSVLDCSKYFRETGHLVREWKAALGDYVLLRCM